MKKILTCLLIVAILGLSACSKSEDVNVTRKDNVVEETQQESKSDEVSTEVIDSDNTAEAMEQKIIPGIYYDKEIYESTDEMESGNFYGFAIRENNEVLIIMQDFAIGQLNDNVIDIPSWETSYTISVEENGLRVKEQDFLYAKCDDKKIVPIEIQNYYETGELPDYMLEAQMTIDYVGDYINPDLHSVSIKESDENGYYNVSISIIRLTTLNGVGNIVDGAMEISSDFGDGKVISAVFYPSSENTFELKITQSDWDYLPAEETFSDFRRDDPDVTVGFSDEFKDEIRTSGDELVIDDSEYSTELLFMTDKNITDFKFLSIETEIYDDGDVFYRVTKEYPVKTFTQDNPLRIKMMFAGDIPNNGFSYKDEDGNEKDYIITISGKDGSIQIFKF